MPRDRFDHLFIQPASFDAALAFYRDALGWEVAFSSGGAGVPRLAGLRSGTMSIVLAEPHAAADRSKTHGINGTRPTLHLVVDDLDRRYEEVSRSGAALFPPEPTHWGARWFVARDPEGNLIAFEQGLETPVGPVSTPAAAIQDHDPEDVAHGYGCGRLNQQGLQLKTSWDGNETVARFRPRPEHTALPGFVYGGLIASLIDCHAMGTAAAAAERAAGRKIGEATAPRYVTGMLKVDYLKPTPLGPELELRGRVVEAAGRKARIEVALSAGGVVTARGEVLAVLMPETMAAPSRSQR